LQAGRGIDLYAEVLYSHTEQNSGSLPPSICCGQFGFYTVPATNPFNPFGEDVGISYLFTNVGRQFNQETTSFIRPLLGAKGQLFSAWDWDVSAWETREESSLVVTNNLDNNALTSALEAWWIPAESCASDTRPRILPHDAHIQRVKSRRNDGIADEHDANARVDVRDS
jgi:hypothetical protein